MGVVFRPTFALQKLPKELKKLSDLLMQVLNQSKTSLAEGLALLPAESLLRLLLYCYPGVDISCCLASRIMRDGPELSLKLINAAILNSQNLPLEFHYLLF